MASSADALETKSYEISIVQATGIKRVKLTLGKEISAHIQIDAADQSWRTKDVAWTDSGTIRWDDKKTLRVSETCTMHAFGLTYCPRPPLPSSTKITFSLFRNSRVNQSKSLVGRLEIRLADLLEQCARRHGEELSLSLEKKKGELTVRIEDALNTALESAIQHLSVADEDVVVSQLGAAADAITAVASAADSSLTGSFTSLMESMGALVAICDEIAKIHPWVNLAWNVLSVGLKLVKAQQDRDSKVTQLVQIMQSTYSTVVGSQTLKNDKPLQDVLERILKQTIVCGFFIQEYTRPRTFAGKTITEAFSSTDSLIGRYLDTFKQLRDEYMGRIATHTALITRDVAATVHDIRFDQLMDKLKPAEMNQVNRGVCLPNTRRYIIKSIMDWYSDDSDQRENVMWVYGSAGTGKSTLSTTIAGMINDLGLLGAFFFFNRQLPHWNFSTLIRTIAYQLAQFDGHIGAKVEQVLKETPNIADMPLAIQFSKLLSAAALGDIPWSKGPVLVVIDALDESGNKEERKGLLKVLSEGSSDLPRFIRLLIVSRPERDINNRLKRPSVRGEELGVDAKTSQADIMEFIRARLQEVREENIEFLPTALQFWPSDDDIQCLAALAAGLFIWAATACRMIEASHDPEESTNELIKRHSSDIYKSVFMSLYQLYKTALQSAGDWDDKAFCSDFKNILGTIMCAQIPLSCQAVDALLGLPRSSAQTVSRLGSVLRGGTAEPIRILHASFHDYLTVPDTVEPWAIDNEHYIIYLAHHCINHLQQELKENMCNLTLPHPITDESLLDSVLYASKYWIEHVCAVTNDAVTLGDVIYRFLRTHLLHWMEALVIIKAYDVALRSLPRLLVWIQRYIPGNQLYDFVRDALRFAQYFAGTIQEHPLLVYVSALPFTPQNTIIYKTFHHDKLPRVVSGVEPTWPPLLQTLNGHTDRVNSIAFTPDGSKLVSGSNDNTIRVWDAITGQEVLPPLQGHKDSIWSVAISPDGCKIVSGSWDKTIRVWDAFTGEEAYPPLQVRGVSCVAFSPDGSKIASGSSGSDKTIRVWDTLTGQEALPPIQGHRDTVRSVSFSPDGSQIVSGSSDNTVRVWDVLTGQHVLPPFQGHEDAVLSVRFSPDACKIVSASWDKTVRVWDALTGREALPPIQGHQHVVWSAEFSPNGSNIVSGSADETIRVWDTNSGQEALLPLQGHRYPVSSVAFSPDRSKIVSGSWDQTIMMWDALTGNNALPLLFGHRGQVNSISFSPDGFKIVSGSMDKTIRVWDALTCRAVLPTLRGHTNAVNSVAFSPDGCKIVSGSYDKTVRVWDALTGQEVLPPLQGHEATVWSAAFSPDGSKIVSGSSDKTIRVWDALTGQEVLPPLQGHEDAVRSVAFSPDGCKIVSGSSDKTIRVWDALTGQHVLPLFKGHDDWLIGHVSFTSDGSKIVSRSSDRTIKVWDALTGEAQAPSVLMLQADNGAQSLVHLVKDEYFVEVSTGRYLCKVPAGLDMNPCTITVRHESLGGSSWFGWGWEWNPVVIHFPLSQ